MTVYGHHVGELAPGGQPDEAVKAADESMYAAKAARRSRSVLVG